MLNIDLGNVAVRFQEHRLSALVMICDFQALSAIKILEEGRDIYATLRIRTTHLPAVARGLQSWCDTSMNALVENCGAISQSASPSRNRTLVVDTSSGECGYIATMGALAVRTLGFSHMTSPDLTSDQRRHALHAGGRYRPVHAPGRREALQALICAYAEGGISS
jgi:hypothetical protein